MAANGKCEECDEPAFGRFCSEKCRKTHEDFYWIDQRQADAVYGERP